MPVINPGFLYVILDKFSTGNRALTETAKALKKGGADFVQYRNKKENFETQLKDVRQLKEIFACSQVRLIVNDDPRLAAEADADGVHLGLNDLSVSEARKILGPGKLTGVSTHRLKEALRGVEAGADYLAVGDLFGSATKTDSTPTTLKEAARISQSVPAPVVGIGGITLENLALAMECGLSGIAVSKGILLAPDIAGRTQEFKLRITQQEIRPQSVSAG